MQKGMLYQVFYNNSIVGVLTTFQEENNPWPYNEEGRQYNEGDYLRKGDVIYRIIYVSPRRFYEMRVHQVQEFPIGVIEKGEIE